MITIATYNILESPAGMPPRFVQIVNEIVNQNADIICLQEVADTKTQDELALQCQYPYFCFYPQTGLLILAACMPIGIVGLISGKYQGMTSAASIGIVAKKPDQFGKAMLFPAMVETYAILALLISILAVNAVQI